MSCSDKRVTYQLKLEAALSKFRAAHQPELFSQLHECWRIVVDNITAEDQSMHRSAVIVSTA